MFHHFGVVAEHNWTAHEKTMHLLAILQGQAANSLQRVLAEAVYGDNVEVLKDHQGDHQLTVV
jgi:hypothetical protein